MTAIRTRPAAPRRRGPSPLASLSRARVVALGAGAALVAAVLVSLATGQVHVPFGDVLLAAVGAPADNGAPFIVGQIRAPRIYTAALVGAILAMSGALFQSVARNALASPDLIGVTAGAATAAVTAIAITGNASSLALAPYAMAGAVATAALIVAMGWSGGIQPARLVIAGIGIGFVATSITTLVLTRLPENSVSQAYAWTVGSTNARTWEHVAIAGAALVAVAAAASYLQRRLRVIEMGDDLAAALGVRVMTVRFVAVAVAALAAGLATAVTGPIGFVALVAPAVARQIGRTGGIAVGTSALVGALLTVLADLAAREVLAPTQLPIGVLTAAVGAPYLLFLLTRLRGQA